MKEPELGFDCENLIFTPFAAAPLIFDTSTFPAEWSDARFKHIGEGPAKYGSVFPRAWGGQGEKPASSDRQELMTG